MRCSGAGAPKVEWGWGIDGAWGELSIPHTLGVGGVYPGGSRTRVTHQSVPPRYDAQKGFFVFNEGNNSAFFVFAKRVLSFERSKQQCLFRF